MIFRIVLSLLADHKDMLLQCRNMEQLMDYFKTTLPSMGSSQLERVIQQVLLLFTVKSVPVPCLFSFSRSLKVSYYYYYFFMYR